MAYVELDLYKKYNDGTYAQLPGGTIVNPPGGLDPYPAVSGDTFHYAFGTRVFPTYLNDTGGNLWLTATGKTWLTDFSPGFITHSVFPAIPGNDDIYDPWAKGLYTDYGIRTHGLTVGAPFETFTTTEWNTMINRIASMGAAVTMVNGQNEVNNARTGTLPSNWAAIAVNHQKLLWQKIQALNVTRAGQGLDPILVGNCNFHSGDLDAHDAAANLVLPQIAGYVDCINFHLYPRGGDPTWELDRMINFYKSHLGDLPVVCTEAGYFVPSDTYVGGVTPTPTTEWAQDIYTRKMWLEYLIRGCRVGQFEFLNSPDPTGNDREKQLGIVETTTVAPSGWSATTAYNNLMEWNSITGGSAGTVPIKIDMAATGVQQIVVKHGTGAKLFLWRRDNIETWNATTDNITTNTLNPATIKVTVTSETFNQTPTDYFVGADVVVVDL